MILGGWWIVCTRNDLHAWGVGSNSYLHGGVPFHTWRAAMDWLDLRLGPVRDSSWEVKSGSWFQSQLIQKALTDA